MGPETTSTNLMFIVRHHKNDGIKILVLELNFKRPLDDFTPVTQKGLELLLVYFS